MSKHSKPKNKCDGCGKELKTTKVGNMALCQNCEDDFDNYTVKHYGPMEDDRSYVKNEELKRGSK